MQYSIAIACRPSVCPSVRQSVCLWRWWIRTTIHTGWKSCKLIAPTISPTPSLFVAQRPSTYSQGNTGKFGGRVELGWEKVACWSTKAAISLKRVKIEQKLYYGAHIGSHKRSFERYHPRPPTPPFLRLEVCNPRPKVQSLLSRERVKLRTSNFVRTFIGSVGTKGH